MIVTKERTIDSQTAKPDATRTNLATPQVEFGVPAIDDAADIHALVKASPPLELNSLYAYALLSSHFAESAVVARCRGKLAGFMCGYQVPDRRDTLFVWQISVHPDFRGNGLGQSMLAALLARDSAAEIRYIEATVSLSNSASYRLFTSFAKRRGCAIDTQNFFGVKLFEQSDHEPERLIRIGPLRSRCDL